MSFTSMSITCTSFESRPFKSRPLTSTSVQSELFRPAHETVPSGSRSPASSPVLATSLASLSPFPKFPPLPPYPGASPSAAAGAHAEAARCAVCHGTRIDVDEVFDEGPLRLSTCLRCEHRWTSREAPSTRPAHAAPVLRARPVDDDGVASAA